MFSQVCLVVLSRTRREGEKTALMTVRKVGHSAEITVADNGPGIPAAFREKVLQRFFRLEASRTTPGNGLGLSAVAAIATLHGARLVLNDNQPGLRCVLHFRLGGEN